MIMFGRVIKTLNIEASSRCNLACPQCIRNYNGQKRPDLIEVDLSLEHLQLLLTPENISTLTEVHFVGMAGDPLMNAQLPEIIRYFRQNNETLQIEIHTNGSLRAPVFYQALAKELKNASGNSTIVFGIDGLSDTNEIYRINSTWSTIEKNVKAFVNAGGIAQWQFIVFEHNKHQLEEAQALAKAWGVSKFLIRYSDRQPVRVNNRRITPVKNPDESRAKLTKEVSCRSVNYKHIVLTSLGIFHPCCYIAMAQYTQSTATKGIREMSEQQRNRVPLSPTLSICQFNCPKTQEGKLRKLDEDAKTIDLTTPV